MRLRPARTVFPRLVALAAIASALLLVSPAASIAHEIPARVTVFAFVKPEGRVLHLVVRVPLEAMRDVEFPLRPNGFPGPPALPAANRPWASRPLFAAACSGLCFDVLMMTSLQRG